MKVLLRQPYANRIMQIALPAIAGMSSQMVVSIIETAMIGRLTESVVSLASYGIGSARDMGFDEFFFQSCCRYAYSRSTKIWRGKL